MNNGRTQDKIAALDFIIHEFDGKTDGQFVWGLERSHLFEKFYAADQLTKSCCV